MEYYDYVYSFFFLFWKGTTHEFNNTHLSGSTNMQHDNFKLAKHHIHMVNNASSNRKAKFNEKTSLYLYKSTT